MHKVEVKLSAMHLGGRKRVLCYVILKHMCECILYFYDEICGIPENVPRFLKNALHILEERQLGLASLHDFIQYSLDVSLCILRG